MISLIDLCDFNIDFYKNGKKFGMSKFNLDLLTVSLILKHNETITFVLNNMNFVIKLIDSNRSSLN